MDLHIGQNQGHMCQGKIYRVLFANIMMPHVSSMSLELFAPSRRVSVARVQDVAAYLGYTLQLMRLICTGCYYSSQIRAIWKERKEKWTKVRLHG
jgi:hypothetical protein